MSVYTDNFFVESFSKVYAARDKNEGDATLAYGLVDRGAATALLSGETSCILKI